MVSKNDLVKVALPAGQAENLKAAIERYSNAALKPMPEVDRFLNMAEAMQELQKVFTPEVVAKLMPLQGSRLGFKTDKDKDGGYPPEVVKRAAVEAVLFGLSLTGNEMNIIASGMYCTKEGYGRKLKEYPGLTDLSIVVGVPVTRDGGAIVPCRATWKIDGKEMSIGVAEGDKCDIPVRVNSGQIVDAILGKAERKLKKRIWDRITNSVMSIPDGEVDEATLKPVEARDAGAQDGPATAEKTRSETIKDRMKATRTGTAEPKAGGNGGNGNGKATQEQVDDFNFLCVENNIDAETIARVIRVYDPKALRFADVSKVTAKMILEKLVSAEWRASMGIGVKDQAGVDSSGGGRDVG